MESKNPNVENMYGITTAPPAYEQHQIFPQAPPTIPYPQQPQVSHASPGVYVPQGPQVVTVITSPAFGPDPMSIQCPSCRQLVNTRIDFESSTKTHLMAALLCLLCWPCFWIPYAVDSCKSTNHYCPSCGAYLGRYYG